MSRFSLSHLSDRALARELPRLAAAERTSAAALIAAIAEVDARNLHATEGYTSLHAYCVGKLELAPDVASKRIQAARAVREFPALLEALDDGRLNVSALVLVAPHLTAENLGEVLAATAGRSKKDIRAILAQRFPRPIPLATPQGLGGATPVPVEPDVTERAAQQDPDPVPTDSDGTALVMEPLSPPAPVRFPLHASITQATRDKLAYARALLGHAVPNGETAEVLDRALDALIAQLEKRRFGKGARSQPARRASGPNEHDIPAALRREVFRRDGGCCTFVGETGHRCGSDMRLEFDHIVPLARGGQTTLANLRLRCRTHNQLEAERAFGKPFMQAKREQAAQRRKRSPRTRPPAPTWQPDVLAALETLGYRATEATRALAACDLGPDATLEQRVRAALKDLAVRARREVPAA